MAYTVVRNSTVFGNKAAVGLTLTADAATQTIETGLKNIEWFSYAPKSMGTANIHMAINSNATGVASFGVFAVTGCASGDNFCITVFGTR